MEVLLGHRGAEALHGGAVQKINPFSFLYSSHPFPSPRMPAQAGVSRKPLYSSVNEILMNPGGKDGEGRAATPQNVFHMPCRYKGPFR